MSWHLLFEQHIAPAVLPEDRVARENYGSTRIKRGSEIIPSDPRFIRAGMRPTFPRTADSAPEICRRRFDYDWFEA
jgi:hypothetical protein